MDCQELRCSVCCQEFEERNPPRNLDCGHSLCTHCLDHLVTIRKRCPECRKTFEGGSAGDLPINYPLLNFTRALTQKKNNPNAFLGPTFPLKYPFPYSCQDAGICPVHGIDMFFMCMSCDTWICRECFVVSHQSPPYGRCFILSTSEAIRKIKKSLSSCLSRDIDAAHTMKIKAVEELDLLKRAVKYSCKSKESEINFQKILAIQANLSKHCETMDAYLITLSNILKCLEKAKENVDETKTAQNVSKSVKESTDSLLAFKKFMSLEEDRATLDIPSIMLDALENDMIKIISSGKSVSVVTLEEENPRWAPLVLREKRLHLYALRSGLPPETTTILSYEFVRALVPKESPMVFLDVGWGGEIKGLVCVRMFGCTPRSLQTIFLCSGEKGPSYRNTCFYQASVDDTGSLIISGGDYENNDGTGGRAFVEGITSGNEYSHAVKAGLFVSWPAHEHWRLGSFEIYLSDDPFAVDHSAHGMVEEGLGTLIDAANITPVTSTSVVDCGLIIPL